MADKTRKLVIEILGDAKDATTALGDVRSGADKTAEGLTKYGGIAVAAGVAVAGGLAFAARESENAEKQSRKLDNSIENSTKTYARNGDGLRDLAGEIQKKTAADADDIVGMQSRLVQFGLEEDQINRLTPLIVDLARKYGIDMDTAAKAVMKSVDGSAGALAKMGIQVDATKAAADPFNATMEALNGTVGGFAEEEGQTFSGQLERLKNQLGDLTEGVGKGAISVVSGLADAASTAAGALSEIDPAIPEAGGKLAAIGAGTSVLIGGLSMAAGKAIELRDRFTEVGDDGERSLNKVGKAAAALGTAAALYAATETVFALVNSSTDVSGRAASALDDLTLALHGAKGGSEDVVTAFSDLVASEQDTLKVQNLWQEFGAEVSIVGTNVKADVEQVQSAFDKLGDTQGPEAQLAVLDALAEANSKLDRNSDQYRTNQEFIDRNRESVEKHAAATAASTTVTAGSTLATGELSATIGGLTIATEEGTSVYQTYADTLRASSDPLFAAINATDALTEAKNKVADAQAKVTLLELGGKQGTEEYTAAVAALSAANDGQVKAAFGLQSQLASLAAGVESGKVSQDQFNATLDQFVRKGQISAAQAQAVRDKVAGVGWQIAALDGSKAIVEVEVRPSVNTGTQEILKGRDLNGNGVIGLATGGPMDAGRPYIVGEKGPELIIPSSSGTVVNASQTARMVGAGGRELGVGEGGTHLHVHFHGPVARDSVGWVADQLAEALRDGKTIPGLVPA